MAENGAGGEPPISIGIEGEAESLADMRALGALVFPPAMRVGQPWATLEWATAQGRMVARSGPQAVAMAGLYGRAGTVDGAPVRIAGIGGVMTHPDWRGRGIATRVLDRTEAALDGDFALLFCEAGTMPFYAARGWRAFAGPVLVRQQGRALTLDFCRAMLFGAAAPAAGTIDLCGAPW